MQARPVNAPELDLSVYSDECDTNLQVLSDAFANVFQGTSECNTVDASVSYCRLDALGIAYDECHDYA